MSADALHVRRTRQAIYGPPISAVIGVALLVSGVLGLMGERGQPAPTLEPLPAPAATGSRATTRASAAKGMALVDADANVYSAADLPARYSARKHNSEAIVGAVRAASGGLWIVDARGHVIARGAPKLGSAPRLSSDVAIAGIATTHDKRGYRLVRTDGRVYSFGATARGELHYKPGMAAVVGIASAANDGYWIVQRDGRVSAFGAKRLGRATPNRTTQVAGIASSPDGRGYWIVTTNGHVWSFGVPFAGGLTNQPGHAEISGIVAAPKGGYWLTTIDGRVWAFGKAAEVPAPRTSPKARVVTLVPPK